MTFDYTSAYNEILISCILLYFKVVMFRCLVCCGCFIPQATKIGCFLVNLQKAAKIKMPKESILSNMPLVVYAFPHEDFKPPATVVFFSALQLLAVKIIAK